MKILAITAIGLGNRSFFQSGDYAQKKMKKQKKSKKTGGNTHYQMRFS